MKQRNNYIDRNELHSEMKAYKDTGVMSERLGQLFITMVDHILGHSNFRNYTTDIKDEMRSHALLLLVKYSHNCDAYQRDARQVFNYLSTVIFNAFKQTLQKYYKRLNTQRELERQYLDLMQSIYGVKINSEFLDNFEDRNIINGTDYYDK